MPDVENLTSDHVDLSNAFAARRYFRKFEAITAHLDRVAARMEREGALSKVDVAILTDYVGRLAATTADGSVLPDGRVILDEVITVP